MMGVALFIREHRGAVARTLRETFGVGLSDLGGALTWGEAKLLIEEAAIDASTALGAELAGWAYPASTRQLIALMAQIGDTKASRSVMPWVLRLDGEPPAAPEDIAAAEAALEDGIVFS